MRKSTKAVNLYVSATPKSHGPSEVGKSPNIDSYVSTTPNTHGSSKVGKSTENADDLYVSTTPTKIADLHVTTPSNSHGLSNVGKSPEGVDSYVSNTLNSREPSKFMKNTIAESGNSGKLKDHNVNLTQPKQLHEQKLSIFWRKEKKLSKKEKHFLKQERFEVSFLSEFGTLTPSQELSMNTRYINLLIFFFSGMRVFRSMIY